MIVSLELSIIYLIIRIATSLELQRILKYAGFELYGHTKEQLFLEKKDEVYNKLLKIRNYIHKVITTRTDMIAA